MQVRQLVLVVVYYFLFLILVWHLLTTYSTYEVRFDSYIPCSLSNYCWIVCVRIDEIMATILYMVSRAGLNRIIPSATNVFPTLTVQIVPITIYTTLDRYCPNRRQSLHCPMDFAGKRPHRLGPVGGPVPTFCH